VEEALDGVTVVLVVLGGVDAALRGDRMRAARAVEDREGQHVVAELAQRGGGRGTRQPRADDGNRVPAAIGGVHELHLELPPRPLVGERAARDLAVERHDAPPRKNSTSGMRAKPPAMTTASTREKRRTSGREATPRLSRPLAKPCER